MRAGDEKHTSSAARWVWVRDYTMEGNWSGEGAWNIPYAAKPEVYISYRKYAVTSQCVSLGAYFQYEMHTSGFAV